MTKGISEKYLKRILLVLFILFILPLLYFALFARAGGDDLVYSNKCYALIQSGNWNILSLLKTAFAVDINFYRTWQGTYSACFIMALQPGIFGEKYYFLSMFVLVLLGFLASLFFVKTVKKYFCPGLKNVILISFAWTSIFFLGLPDIREGFFTHNSSSLYTFFFFLVLINSGLVINIICTKKAAEKNVFLVLSFILSFIISGGTQMVGFLNILLILLIFALSIFYKNKNRAMQLVFPFISAIAGFILTLVAPGTSVRRVSEIDESPGVIVTITKCVFKLIRMMAEWINLNWICYMVILIPIAFAFIRDKRIKCRIHPILLYMVFFVLLVGMLCVPYYAMGNFGLFSEGRLMDVVWLSFMVLSAIAFIYTAVWANEIVPLEPFMKLKDRLDIQLVVVVCVVLLGLSGNSNGYKVVNEIRMGAHKQYAQSYDARVEQVKGYKGKKTLYVDPLYKGSALLDSDDWMTPWQEYYNVDVDVLEEDVEE